MRQSSGRLATSSIGLERRYCPAAGNSKAGLVSQSCLGKRSRTGLGQRRTCNPGEDSQHSDRGIRGMVRWRRVDRDWVECERASFIRLQSSRSDRQIESAARSLRRRGGGCPEPDSCKTAFRCRPGTGRRFQFFVAWGAKRRRKPANDAKRARRIGGFQGQETRVVLADRSPWASLATDTSMVGGQDARQVDTVSLRRHLCTAVMVLTSILRGFDLGVLRRQRSLPGCGVDSELMGGASRFFEDRWANLPSPTLAVGLPIAGPTFY